LLEEYIFPFITISSPWNLNETSTDTEEECIASGVNILDASPACWFFGVFFSLVKQPFVSWKTEHSLTETNAKKTEFVVLPPASITVDSPPA